MAAVQAAEAGESVVLTNDVTVTTDLVIKGSTLDGNGKTITVENAANDRTNFGVTATAGGTIKNVTVTGEVNEAGKHFYAVFGDGLGGDVVIENCTLNGTYPINIQNGSEGAGNLIVKNSTLLGWTSYSLGSAYSAEFTDCTFGMGNTGYSTIMLSAHDKSVFDGCVFEDGFKMGARASAAGASIILNDCVYNNTELTADNVQSLLIYDDSEVVTALKGCTITVNGETVALTE